MPEITEWERVTGDPISVRSRILVDGEGQKLARVAGVETAYAKHVFYYVADDAYADPRIADELSERVGEVVEGGLVVGIPLPPKDYESHLAALRQEIGEAEATVLVTGSAADNIVLGPQLRAVMDELGIDCHLRLGAGDDDIEFPRDFPTRANLRTGAGEAVRSGETEVRLPTTTDVRAAVHDARTARRRSSWADLMKRRLREELDREFEEYQRLTAKGGGSSNPRAAELADRLTRWGMDLHTGRSALLADPNLMLGSLTNKDPGNYVRTISQVSPWADDLTIRLPADPDPRRIHQEYDTMTRRPGTADLTIIDIEHMVAGDYESMAGGGRNVRDLTLIVESERGLPEVEKYLGEWRMPAMDARYGLSSGEVMTTTVALPDSPEGAAVKQRLADLARARGLPPARFVVHHVNDPPPVTGNHEENSIAPVSRSRIEPATSTSVSRAGVRTSSRRPHGPRT